MSLELAVAHVSLTAKRAEFERGLAAAQSTLTTRVAVMQAKLNRLGDAFQRIGRSMRLWVTLPIAGAFAYSLKAASAFEETGSKFRAVFKSLSGQAEQWADDFGNSVGRSKADLMSYMATLQDTFVPLGFSRKEALGLSSALTKLTVDLGSFNNMADPEVLRSLQSAIVGNHETVRKFGVILTEAGVKAEIFRAGMAKTEAEITDAMKAQARYNLIVKGTADAQDDALRTSGSFANQMKRLRSNAKALAELIGKDLAPATLALADKFRAGIQWLRGLDDGTRKLIVTFAALAAAAGPVLMVLGTLLKLKMAATIAGAVGTASKLGMAMGVIGKGAAVVGVAIAGWQIGEQLGKALKLQEVFESMMGADKLTPGQARMEEKYQALLARQAAELGISVAEYKARKDAQIAANNVERAAAREKETEDVAEKERMDQMAAVKRELDKPAVTGIRELWERTMGALTLQAPKAGPVTATLPAPTTDAIQKTADTLVRIEEQLAKGTAPVLM